MKCPYCGNDITGMGAGFRDPWSTCANATVPFLTAQPYFPIAAEGLSTDERFKAGGSIEFDSEAEFKKLEKKYKK